MAQADPRRMRLAATLEAERGAIRQAIGAPATLRDGGDAPCDIVILDISATGFLAELPAGVTLDPGARVRVAMTQIGCHHAVLVRSDGGRHGFVFVRPLDAGTIGALGPWVSNVRPLFAMTTPAAAIGRRLSPRASLLLLTGIAGGMWGTLGTLLYLTA